ncbi:MAG: tetratricopeptide repeat protein, partial [Thermoanaerobaculia bacterium]
GAAAGGRAARSPRSAEEALKDLSESDELKLSEAEYHRRLGDEAYQNLDYARAVKEYRAALDINPAMADVRERWARVSLVLGIRGGEVEAVHREFIEGDRVRKQERYADVQHALREGQSLLDEGDLGNAERKFRKVYEELLWFEFPVDVTPLREEVKGKLNQVAQMKRQGERRLRDELVKTADQKAQEAIEQENKIRDQRVRELVRRAADYIRLRDYDKAIDACQRILELRPDHRLARFWLKDVKSQQHDHHRLQLYKDQLENRELTRESLEESVVPYTEYFVFPPEGDWNLVRNRQQRLEVISIRDPEWVSKIKLALETPITFSFEQRPLSDALNFLHDATGITIITDQAINTQEFQIDLTAKEMKAIDALNQILTITGLAYTFTYNTLYITQKEKAKGTATFAIYNVSDILNKIRDFPGPSINLKSADDTSGSGQQ